MSYVQFSRMRNCFLALTALSLLCACSSTLERQAKYPTGTDRSATPGGENDIYSEPDSILGKGGLSLLGGKSGDSDETGIGVNAYLWRAALDTVSFMPLASADPFGGTILTDWYATPENANERLKLNVFVLGKQLRSDGIRARVFRQVRGKDGSWKDATVSPETPRKVEDSILARARQLRADKVVN